MIQAGDRVLVTPQGVPTWCGRTEPYHARVVCVNGDSVDVDCCPEPVPIEWCSVILSDMRNNVDGDD